MKLWMRVWVGLVLLVGVTAGFTQSLSRTVLLVESARVGGDGRVFLRWTGQAEKVMARDRDGYCENVKICEDAGASQLTVSDDRRSVGWTAEYNACCQSYPIPMVLVIARDGQVVHRIQRIRPIWQWRFEQGGDRVAVLTGPTHGDSFSECALYDTRTWRVIDEWHRGKSATLPEWAKPFAKAIGSTTEEPPQ